VYPAECAGRATVLSPKIFNILETKFEKQCGLLVLSDVLAVASSRIRSDLELFFYLIVTEIT
jgi:hypothetical protein